MSDHAEPIDPDVAAELVTMSDMRLAALGGEIIHDLATAAENAGQGHIGALNMIVSEAARRCIARRRG